MMRRFQLRRAVDHSGVSGTGVVAEGVEFSNNHVALTWLTKPGNYRYVPMGVAIYESTDHVLEVHGHDGDTVLDFLD